MDLTRIVDSVGWPGLAIMAVFFALTVWWGFRGRPDDGRDDE